jgi:hypothetical protein
VTGLVTAPGPPEPVMINAVTVQIDSQPAVKATLKHIINKQLIEVTFNATVQITGGQDPHTVAVTVTSDAGVPVTKMVTVTAGARLVAPAVLIDLATLVPTDPSLPMVQTMLSGIAQALASMPLVGQLEAAYKIVVGPSALEVTEPRPMLRLGIWILEANFPAAELLPASKEFPLRRLTPDVVAGCFGLVPLLYPPPPSTVPPATDPMFGFAMSVPTTTLQLMLNAMFPDIATQAASSDFTLEDATIRVDASGSVTTSFSGQLPLSISMTASVTEKLGIAQRTETEQFMPVVTAASSSVSVGDEAQWFVASFVPAVGLILAAASGLVSGAVSEGAGQANGIISGFLQSLPARIPFRNSELPTQPIDLQPVFPFPMSVLNFESFSTDGSGIVATGTISLGERDQSVVTVSLSGPTYFPNYTAGVDGYYSVSLTHFEPDNDQMTWKVSGAAKADSVSIDAFWQQGGFAAEFPVALKAAPGKYRYTISVSATETCATDSTRTLSGSASMTVTTNVTGGPPQ